MGGVVRGEEHARGGRAGQVGWVGGRFELIFFFSFHFLKKSTLGKFNVGWRIDKEVGEGAGREAPSRA